MEPFLRQVARAYVSHEAGEMVDYAFIFPNKRSGVFFRRYLIELASGRPIFLPAITTIAEVVGEFSDSVEASRLDQLFTLYNEYCKLSPESDDFDRFLYWGEMILSDFNDVNRDLVDHEKLFVNLKRYKEVSADYLTPEQEEILTRYWGAEFVHTSPDRFWEHLHREMPTELENRFLRLWEVLAPLYDNFTATLRADGLATQGMMVRQAVETLRTAKNSDLRYKRYIFVGFNVLSLSELKIFACLRDRGVADFYWDLASPSFHINGNRAMRFLSRNVKLFPSRYASEVGGDIAEGYMPDIDIVGIPSSVGQAKAAGDLLARWAEDGTIPDTSNAMTTAVVLPDEGLLLPMVHSVPKSIPNLNVTMSLPLKLTSLASLVSLLTAMHLRSRQTGEGTQFFHEEVRRILTHPLVQRLDGPNASALLGQVSDRRLYMVDASLAGASGGLLGLLFAPIADPTSPADVYAYFNSALTGIYDMLQEDAEPAPAKEEEGEDVKETTPAQLESMFIVKALDALDELMKAIGRHGIRMKEATFVRLFERAISGAGASLTGEPLKGLQMMGVLETRALDFENIIMLSMNERIFPRKHYTRSFIPETLRRAYGMATTDYQESIYAYYFYRLISRARKVTLYYDARSSGLQSGERSRYIAQLLYLSPDIAERISKGSITHTLDSYPATPPKTEPIVIRKDSRIERLLDEFRADRGGQRTISASSINDYINCPLSFYLKRLCRLDLDNEVTDYMDSATYGDILHKVAERIYKHLRGNASEVVVTAALLDGVIAHKTLVDSIITQTVNEIFNKIEDPAAMLATPLRGEAKALGMVMKTFINLMLEEDKKLTPFEFIDAEHEIKGVYKVDDTLSINLYQIIDRIDRVNGTLRIVDYKTGHDKTDFKEMDDLFDNSRNERRKAILQTLFYCNAYVSKHPAMHDSPIQPVIYKIATVAKEGIQPIKNNGEALRDYRTVNDGFLDRLNSTLRELFDLSMPFVQAPRADNCKFCTFKDICRR